MTVRTIIRKRAFLPVLLLAVTIAVTTAAGADQQPKPLKGDCDTPAVMKDIRDGKAKKLHTPPGRAKRTAGVWTGCKFVYLTTDISEYEFDDGSLVQVSENPKPLPPKDKDCVDRNPTDDEIDAMHAVVDASNAGGRPPGAENRPLPPRPRAR